ncbi:MAG: MFS transporter, partial [Planctomycetota bacterium]
MTRAVRIQLSIMMFLQFFIWGAWLPQSFGYWEGVLGFTPWQAMMLDMAFPISAILAMFFANQFADRNFAAEKFLAFSHLIGGVALLAFGFLARSFLAAKVGNPDAAANFWLFFGCMAIHCLFYVPTMSVTNTILFAAATNPQKDFGPIRLWGTIGWIAAAWPFIFILTDWGKVPAMSETSGLTEWLGKAMGTPLSGDALNLGKSWTFITAGAASLILAVLSLSLPHTPPKKNVEAGNSLAWVEALKT